MSNLSRTLSISVARTSLGGLVLGLTLLGLWSASDLWGQAPQKPDNGGKKNQRVEEEEDTPTVKKPSKTKVIRVEEEEDTKKPSKAAASAAAAGNLGELADQAKQPSVRKLFRDLAVPHDQMVFKKSLVTVNNQPASQERNIEPIPYYIPDAEKFRGNLGVNEFDLKWIPSKVTFHPTMTSLRQIRPYERIAEERVREFLSESWPQQNKNYVPPLDKLVAAEQVLSAVLRWHESARQTGIREGDVWSPIEAELRKQLLDEVLLKQLGILADAKDWDRVVDLARRMANSYSNSADRERIAKPIAELIQNSLKDDTSTAEKKQEVRKRLSQLEMEFPDNAAFRPLGEGLRQQAQGYLEAAKKLAGGNDPDKAQRIRDLIHQAEELWPQLPGLRAFKVEQSQDHPVLRVGMRGKLPSLLSPALACTDNERRVVEMLFESLVKLTPDNAGIYHYRLGLAEFRPKIVTLGREFQLPRNASWFDPRQVGDRPPPRLDSGDIRFTMELLKQGEGTGRCFAWGQLLDNVEVKGDPFRVTLRLNQGYLDPLALMTFKILPRDRDVKSEQFAQNPVSSGPFRLVGPRSDERNIGYLGFVANPAYSTRSSKRDLPHIQEVRLYASQNPLEDMRKGELDLALDLTADEADKLMQQAAQLNVTVPLPAPSAPNRRVYFLAINQLKVPVANLRRALYYAINREELLDKHFRKGLKRQVHKALNCPFPAGSWACNLNGKIRPEKNSLDPFDPAKAKSLSVDIKALGAVPLKLKYPKDDPALDEAMRELCEQVKNVTGIALEPFPCDPYRLREDVEQTQSYDLAYYHYDFPDETYWLWPLFSPHRATDDANFLKFANEEFQQLLKDSMTYRNFAQVRGYVQEVHKKLEQEMPFIPVWQLDPLLAHTRDVSPVDLDPHLVFTSIEEWRLQPQRK